MQPRPSQGIGVEHSQRGEYCIGHAEVQRGSPSGGRQQGQQEQHDHDDLRGEPYVEEQHEVRHQQKVEFRARIERPAGRIHQAIPALMKCFFIMRWPNQPPRTAHTRIAIIEMKNVPVLMLTNTPSM